MNIKRQTTQLVEAEDTLTPEFCYERAGQILSDNSVVDYLRRPGNGSVVSPEAIAGATAWRELGDSLARLVGA